MTKARTLAFLIATAFAASAQAGPFDALLDAFKPKEASATTAQDGQTDGQSLGALFDYTKVISQPMTARQLFETNGMVSTVNLLQKMTADAKAGKNGMMMDSLGALTLDTGAILRLALRMTASHLSYSALENLMTSFSNNPKIMDGVSINVPQLGALGQLQLQEDTMGVARFLVAMKASNLLVAESEKSLEAAKIRYAQVMADRDDKAKSLGAATMLVNGVFNLSDASLKAISGQDLGYLKGFYGKPLEEVLKDPTANLMINRELSTSNPNEYKSIAQGEKEVATHYAEYAKTTAGTLSMLGFAATFLNNVMDMGRRSAAHQVLLVPMAKDGAVELFGIVKNVISALSKNDDLVEGTFTITADGKTTAGVPASKVLKSLSSEQLDGFRNAMVGNSNQSYLSQLDRRSTNYAADILDRLVDRDNKGAFAKTVYSMDNADMFSFKSAFAGADGKSTLKPIDLKVKRRLYEDNFDKAEDSTEQLYGKLQRDVKVDVTKLTNQDLRRIMMVQGLESLQIGSALVRLEQPGLQGLADRQEMTVAALSQAKPDIEAPKRSDKPVAAEIKKAGKAAKPAKPAAAAAAAK